MKKLVLMALMVTMIVALTGCGEAPVATIEPEGIESIEVEAIEMETIEVKGIEVKPITVTCGNVSGQISL